MPVSPIQTLNVQNTIANLWDRNYRTRFRGFEQLQVLAPFWDGLPSHAFPSIHDYNRLAAAWYEMQMVPPYQHMRFEQQRASAYLAYIQQGVVLTRLNNWHDYFNNLTWLLWPRTKWELYQHYLRGRNHPFATQRSPLQNFIALFDECGAVVAYTDPVLPQLIQQREWKELFCMQRARCADAQLFIFGHGLFEKGLKPYRGITANTLFIQVESCFFSWHDCKKWNWLDKALALQAQLDIQALRLQRSPLPLMGWPRWDPQQHQPDFYDNQDVFRPLTQSKHIG